VAARLGLALAVHRCFNLIFQENNMKTFRQLCAASILTLTLSLSAFAGEMSTTVAPPAPPSNATAAGIMSTTIAPDSDTADSGETTVIISATEAALNALLSLLGLL
jgi:hypothetical protein